LNNSTTVAASGAKVKKKRRFLSRWDAPFAGYLFISPWLIGFFGLTAYPMFLSLYYSLTDYTLLEPIKWIGLRNYTRIFTDDPRFTQSVKVTFQYVLASVPLKLVAALLVATLLNKAMKGISFYRTAFIFPLLLVEVLLYRFCGAIFLVLMESSMKFFPFSV
jgi:multiple sugar transport system permease protein